MLAQRLLTAAAGIPLIAGVILLGGLVYDIVVVFVLATASLEFCAIEDARPPWRTLPYEYGAAVAAGLFVGFASKSDDTWTGPLTIIVCLTLLAVTATGTPVRFRPRWLSVPAAALYVGFLGAHFVLLRDLDGDGRWVFLPLLATWTTDTFAYGVGRLIGRTKIAPRISPGKTLEGTAAGLVGGFAAVIVIAELLDLPMTLGEEALLGALLPAAAVLGDLVESHVKRSAGVKDTSELVPGHGGFLDRLDSLLFTVPLVYYFAIWVVA